MTNPTDPTPRVSVVVPTYNSPRTVGGTITGALTQTYPDVEVVVVDDGSTDEHTSRIVRAFEPLVRVVAQPNGGLSNARNAGLRAATGEFVAFCDADDIYMPQAVERMHAAWREAGGGRRLVTANAYTLTQEGINPRRSTVMWSYPPPERQRLALFEGNFASVFAFGPRELFLELGGYDESLPVIEDWDLWIRAALSGVEIVYLREPHILYRWTKGSLSSDKTRMYAVEQQLLERYARDWADRLDDAERAYLAERLASGSPRELRDRADDALRRGDREAARRDYVRAARLLRHDRKLQLKARTVAFGPAARLWRNRLVGVDEAVGRQSSQGSEGPQGSPGSRG